MKAADLAARLMKHPEADVMVLDPHDVEDYDFLNAIVYYEESDRFHLLTSCSLTITADPGARFSHAAREYMGTLRSGAKPPEIHNEREYRDYIGKVWEGKI